MQTSFEHAALLLRVWDNFIVFGWKGIFKASISLLKEYEDVLLGMPFEVLLTQMVNLPVKYLITPAGKEEGQAVSKFDRTMKQLKVPTMLLERLKREFDMNYKLSGSISKS
jgi:hypothetical protein